MPIVEVDRASEGWDQSQRLKEVARRAPVFAALSRNSKHAKRTYVGAMNMRTGDTVLASSGGGHCAEGNALKALGGDISEVIFTDAYQVKRVGGSYKAEIKPVCTNCQGDYSPDSFVPGIQADKGGAWGR